MIRPGEIYLADFEEMEPHPIVVVSREELNRGNWVAAVLITSMRFEERSKQPRCVAIRAGEFGLSKNCVAQGESLFFPSVGKTLAIILGRSTKCGAVACARQSAWQHDGLGLRAGVIGSIAAQRRGLSQRSTPRSRHDTAKRPNRKPTTNLDIAKRGLFPPDHIDGQEPPCQCLQSALASNKMRIGCKEQRPCWI